MNIILLVILGWKEIYMTSDIQAYMRVKVTLENKSIRTKSRVVYSRNRRERGVIGTTVNNNMHYLYVKQEKYEEASHLLK